MSLNAIVDTRRKWTEVLGLITSKRGESTLGAYIAVLEELVQLAERRTYDSDAFRCFREDLGKQELLFEAALHQLQLSSRVWPCLNR